MEENCEYLGELVYKSPTGTIVGPNYCQQLCTEFEAFNCKYWYYVGSEKICSLYDSYDRACQALGGGQIPSIEQCMGKE